MMFVYHVNSDSDSGSWTESESEHEYENVRNIPRNGAKMAEMELSDQEEQPTSSGTQVLVNPTGEYSDDYFVGSSPNAPFAEESRQHTDFEEQTDVQDRLLQQIKQSQQKENPTSSGPYVIDISEIEVLPSEPRTGMAFDDPYARRPKRFLTFKQRANHYGRYITEQMNRFYLDNPFAPRSVALVRVTTLASACFFSGWSLLDMIMWSCFSFFMGDLVETLPFGECQIERFVQLGIHNFLIFIAGACTSFWNYGFYCHLLIAPIVKTIQLIHLIGLFFNAETAYPRTLKFMIAECMIYVFSSLLIYGFFGLMPLLRQVSAVVKAVYTPIVNKYRAFKRWCSSSTNEVQGAPHVMIGMVNMDCAMEELRRSRERRAARFF